MTPSRDRLTRRRHTQARKLGPQGLAIVESTAARVHAWPILPAPDSPLTGTDPLTPGAAYTPESHPPAPKRYTVRQRHAARARVEARTIRYIDPSDIRECSTLHVDRMATKPVPVTVRLTQYEIDRRK